MKYQKLVIIIKRGEKVTAEFTLTFFWKYETITSIVLLQFIQINIHISGLFLSWSKNILKECKQLSINITRYI